VCYINNVGRNMGVTE